VGALMLLEQQGHWDRLKRNIVIDVFNTDNDEDVAALFKVCMYLDIFFILLL
jgi:hypothetical protein